MISEYRLTSAMIEVNILSLFQHVVYSGFIQWCSKEIR